MDNSNKEWFEEWFDSPYYDLLYQKRDFQEAAGFLGNLLSFLHPTPGAQVLDLACGKGRHSVYLHEQGYEVTGIDLSTRSIQFAKQFERPGLKFLVQDMREPVADTAYDLVLNLFTSFGYFDNPKDNAVVLHSVHRMLKPMGLFVMDYLNREKLVQTLVESEVQEFPEARFTITRRIENQFVVKKIVLLTNNSEQHFQEKVRLFTKEELHRLHEDAGLSVLHLFGDYQLAPYQAHTSDRIILISCRKNR